MTRWEAPLLTRWLRHSSMLPRVTAGVLQIQCLPSGVISGTVVARSTKRQSCHAGPFNVLTKQPTSLSRHLLSGSLRPLCHLLACRPDLLSAAEKPLRQSCRHCQQNGSLLKLFRPTCLQCLRKASAVRRLRISCTGRSRSTGEKKHPARDSTKLLGWQPIVHPTPHA